MENKIFNIPLEDIKIGDLNVRKTIDEDDLEELSESIKLHGLLQPIVLKGTYGHPPYEVIVGQRRFLAHKKLDKDKINASFTGEIDEVRATLLSIAENIQRTPLTYNEISNAITVLYKHYDKDERKVKQVLGISLRKVRDYLKIEERGTSKIKKLLSEGKLKIVDAKRAINAASGDLKKADKIVDEIIKLTAYEKDRVVEYGEKNPKANVEEILNKAKKPRIEETIMINLSAKLTNAMRTAAADLEMELESLAIEALTGWLKSNDYLK